MNSGVKKARSSRGIKKNLMKACIGETLQSDGNDETIKRRFF